VKLRGLAWSLLLLPTLASASAFRLESRTEAQLYSLRTFRDGDPTTLSVLPRRRLVQYLGLEAYELITGEPLGFETSLRVFADWGLPHGEAAKLDGIRSEDADLLYANVFYRGEHLQARVGRQTYIDIMDITSFDGALVRYVHKIGIGAEAYAGLWVKGSSVLASSVYQPDGIRESDLRRVGLMVARPYAALDDIEPVVGAKLLVENIAGFSGSFGFRQAWLSGKTDIQRLALEAKYGGTRGLIVLGGAEYDLVMARVSNLRLQGRYDGTEVAVLAEVMRVTPVLSADSIFLYFATAPRDAARIRADYYPSGPFRFYAQLGADLYNTVLNDKSAVYGNISDPMTTEPAASPLSISGNVGVGWRQGTVRGGADGTVKAGYGGRQIWVDVNLGWAPENGVFSLDGRLSFANVEDSLNKRLKGNFFGVQLWGSYFLNRNTRASLVLEENLNSFSKSDTKVFFMLDWKITI
jgi:hypothetical protein